MRKKRTPVYGGNIEKANAAIDAAGLIPGGPKKANAILAIEALILAEGKKKPPVCWTRVVAEGLERNGCEPTAGGTLRWYLVKMREGFIKTRPEVLEILDPFDLG